MIRHGHNQSQLSNQNQNVHQRQQLYQVSPHLSQRVLNTPSLKEHRLYCIRFHIIISNRKKCISASITNSNSIRHHIKEIKTQRIWEREETHYLANKKPLPLWNYCNYVLCSFLRTSQAKIPSTSVN